MRNFTATIPFVVLMEFREIEKVYKEYCEGKGKGQSECQDGSLSVDLMLTDSTVWQTVRDAQTLLVLGLVRSVYSVEVTFWHKSGYLFVG